MCVRGEGRYSGIVMGRREALFGFEIGDLELFWVTNFQLDLSGTFLGEKFSA